MDFAWAYGAILGGALLQPSSSDEGTAVLNLSLPNIPPSGAQLPGPRINETNETFLPGPSGQMIPSGASLMFHLASLLSLAGLVLQLTL